MVKWRNESVQMPERWYESVYILWEWYKMAKQKTNESLQIKTWQNERRKINDKTSARV